MRAEPKPNLVFLPLQPMDVFPDVLGAADVLVALLENDAGPFSVPSKVLSYLCAGRPILLSAPPSNLSVRLVEKAAAGLCVPAGNRPELSWRPPIGIDVSILKSLFKDGRKSFSQVSRETGISTPTV